MKKLFLIVLIGLSMTSLKLTALGENEANVIKGGFASIGDALQNLGTMDPKDFVNMNLKTISCALTKSFLFGNVSDIGKPLFDRSGRPVYLKDKDNKTILDNNGNPIQAKITWGGSLLQMIGIFVPGDAGQIIQGNQGIPSIGIKVPDILKVISKEFDKVCPSTPRLSEAIATAKTTSAPAEQKQQMTEEKAKVMLPQIRAVASLFKQISDVPKEQLMTSDTAQIGCMLLRNLLIGDPTQLEKNPTLFNIAGNFMTPTTDEKVKARIKAVLLGKPIDEALDTSALSIVQALIDPFNLSNVINKVLELVHQCPVAPSKVEIGGKTITAPQISTPPAQEVPEF